jgi:Ni/Co efflux regulator RcnB
MNRTALLAAIAVLVTSLGAPVGAQGRDDRHDRDDRGRGSQGQPGRSNDKDPRAQRNHQRQPQAAQRPHDREYERPYPRQYERQYERQYPRPYPRQVQRHPGERGAGPDHNFYRGARLPARDHNRYAVVDDWRGHRLNQPPRGYHWVQTGGDYVLVAIATGIILQLMLNN